MNYDEEFLTYAQMHVLSLKLIKGRLSLLKTEKGTDTEYEEDYVYQRTVLYWHETPVFTNGQSIFWFTKSVFLATANTLWHCKVLKQRDACSYIAVKPIQLHGTQLLFQNW